MSRELLNTLFVMSQGAYVHLDYETARVELNKHTIMRVPLHHLGGIVAFGNVMISPHLMQKCASEGRVISFLDMNGRFRARVVGATTGNVLLRRDQFSVYFDEAKCLHVVKSIIAGKLHNQRSVILRAAREAQQTDKSERLRVVTEKLASYLQLLQYTETVEEARGYEGQAGADYFSVFDDMVLKQKTDFKFTSRNRRPPRDRINALLSFTYALVQGDCLSALEGVGLDPQVGFLHALRSGRPALVLDLMEEFRPSLADRMVLNMVNRQVIGPQHFDDRVGGSVYLNDEGRKAVVGFYQKRKQLSVTHQVLKNQVTVGLIPHIQARILARYLRGDIPVYIPYRPR